MAETGTGTGTEGISMRKDKVWDKDKYNPLQDSHPRLLLLLHLVVIHEIRGKVVQGVMMVEEAQDRVAAAVMVVVVFKVVGRELVLIVAQVIQVRVGQREDDLLIPPVEEVMDEMVVVVIEIEKTAVIEMPRDPDVNLLFHDGERDGLVVVVVVGEGSLLTTLQVHYEEFILHALHT